MKQGYALYVYDTIIGKVHETREQAEAEALERGLVIQMGDKKYMTCDIKAVDGEAKKE